MVIQRKGVVGSSGASVKNAFPSEWRKTRRPSAEHLLIVVLDSPRLDLARAVIDVGVYLIASLVFDLEFSWQVEELGGRMLAVSPALSSVRGKADILWRCHDLAEIETTGDAEFVSLSPIFPTASKPGYGPPLGLGVLGQAARPVYALGGIDTPQRAVACIESGARGVAVMGAITRAENPHRVAERFLGALQ
jgi:hypothetical protein